MLALHLNPSKSVHKLEQNFRERELDICRQVKILIWQQSNT